MWQTFHLKVIITVLWNWQGGDIYDIRIHLVDLCPVVKWSGIPMVVWKPDWKRPVYGKNVRYSNGLPSHVTTIWILDTHTVWYTGVQIFFLHFRLPEVPAWHAILSAPQMDLSVPELEKLILATKVIPVKIYFWGELAHKKIISTLWLI